MLMRLIMYATDFYETSRTSTSVAVRHESVWQTVK